MTRQRHLDTFARDNLPPRAPVAGLPVRSCRSCNYPDRHELRRPSLLDRWIASGDGDRILPDLAGETTELRASWRSA